MLRNILICILISSPVFAQARSVQTDTSPTPNPAVQILIDELGLRESATAARDLPGWSPPKKVVIRNIESAGKEACEAVAPGVEIVLVESTEQAVRAVEGADALLGSCNEDLLSLSKELFWVQVYSAGVERCVSQPGMKTGDKLLTNAQRIDSAALAEHAIAMMFALARGLDIYYSNQINDGKWQRNKGLQGVEILELEGRTLLVVGLGGIGTQVAKRAHGLGMKVLATRGSRREGPDYIEYVGLADEVNELASRADVVINTVPLTDKTLGMFDSAFFDAMKPRAIYVSVGRGKTTVTDDLVVALNSGSIAGAGLDVTDPEPLPEGHPLWTTPRVIISPHAGWRSDKGDERLLLMVQENLRRYVAGDPMLSVVDIERGY